MKRKRTSNGKFAKDSKYFKERLVAPIMLVLTTAFTWGVSLSPTIYKTFYEVDSVQANAGQTQMLHEAESTPLFIEPKENLIEEIKETPEDKTQKQEIIEYIVKVFGENAPEAFNVLRCENKGLRPDAENWNRNGTWDAGIFQINQVHGYTIEEMKDYKKNVDAAYKIFERQGWTPWSCAHKVDVKPFYQK